MKKTLKTLLTTLAGELKKDEGAWLKVLGECGDLARFLLKLQKEIEELRLELKEHKKGTK